MHDKIEIDDKILSIYLSYLVTAVLIWEKHSYRHMFIPIFLVEDKENVMKILHSADINVEFNILRKQIFLS